MAAETASGQNGAQQAPYLLAVRWRHAARAGSGPGSSWMSCSAQSASSSKSLLSIDLALDQLGVWSAVREKLIVGAALDNDAVLQNQDLIGVFNGAEAVGNDNPRA